jgi:hypothetical protein
LIGEHQPGRTRAYDEHVSMRWDGHQKSHTNGVSDCNRVMRHSPSSNCSIPRKKPEGFPAISRWLSKAIPPEKEKWE